MPEFFVFLPQMRMTFDGLVERARAAETAGFTGMAFMDHLAPPGALEHPMYEAIVTATWLAARTERLKVGHLVLCDAFRHPAMLAKEAVSLDHASGGRFELGIGWGSVPAEFITYGVGSTAARMRVKRLAETLAVIQALWSGEIVNYEGEFHQIEAGQHRPTPLDRIPILIGGAGPATLELVAAYADWWNLPVHALDKIDELKPRTGKARTSIQQMVSFVPSESARAEVTETTMRRFGNYGRGLIIGDAGELGAHFAGLRDRGVERFYVWFTDFASPATLAQFSEVIGAVSTS